MNLSKQNGFALVGAIAVCSILTIVAMGLVNVVVNEVENEAKSFENDRAFLAAESGLLFGATWVKDPSSCQQVKVMSKGSIIENIFPDLAVNGITVQVDIIKQDSGVDIRSTAFCNDELGYNKTQVWSAYGSASNPYDHIFNGNCGFVGGGENTQIYYDGIYNTDIKCNGNVQGKKEYDIKVYGNISAHGNVQEIAPEEGGTIEENAAEIEVPEFDYDSYFKEANSDGIVYNGDMDFENITLDPDNGVVYVKGNVVIKGNVTLNGCIVARDNIKIEGSFTQNQVVDNMPALLSKNGNIDLLHQGGTITGVISSRQGNIMVKERWTFQGGLIAGENVQIENYVELNIQDGSPIWSFDGGDFCDNITFERWREFMVAPGGI